MNRKVRESAKWIAFAAVVIVARPMPLGSQQPGAAPAVPVASALVPVPCPQADTTCVPPLVSREFRGVWVASVRNLDWPSKPGLPPALAKAELVALLDTAVADGLNAVLFQVRPAGDALYESAIEPWSEYLTGRQGRAPVPLWDPLAFAVAAAHARGLELHAWFNPYRAKEPSAKGPLAPSHIARRHPELVKKYGTQLWMDPGEPAVRDQTVRVVMDVIRRYDIDGVHLDDYFYPYPESRSRRNHSTDFPDERSWTAYKKRGGTLSRDDWRRSNVDELVETLHREISKAKPWVKFGISPFQLWRPGYPASVTTGLDAYATLYADSRKWFMNGWVDYLSPQLYRRVDEERSFGILLKWWSEQNVLSRHLWPGLYTSGVRTGAAAEWRRSEIVAQVLATRDRPAATGDVHFSMEAFLTNRDSIGTELRRSVYRTAALVPDSPWMGVPAPVTPVMGIAMRPGEEVLTIAPGSPVAVRWWLVQRRLGDLWETYLFDGAQHTFKLPASVLPASAHPPSPEIIAATAIGRAGGASAATALRVR